MIHLAVLLLCLPPILPSADSAEDRAIAYLEREVPRWSRENHCFSCHNNADGARALLLGLKPGQRDKTLEDTLRWLAQPDKWDHNGGEGPFSDKRLARLQFAAALADATRAGAIKDQTILIKLAERLRSDQQPDGSFAPDGPDAIGSPATLGRPLATLTAREVLRQTGSKAFDQPIARANAWLRKLEPRTTIDAAVILLSNLDPKQMRKALDFLLKAQADTGGWGPYADAPPEAFDTALVLLALHAQPQRPAEAIKRGRAYLLKSQLDDGSWPETTRPSGGESYAQRVSTAGWATRALLITR